MVADSRHRAGRFRAGSGARFLTVNNDTRIFFSESNPQLQALEALENTYNKTNTFLITLAPAGGEVFTREILAAVEALTWASWQAPYAIRVSSITNFQNTRARGDDLIVTELRAIDKRARLRASRAGVFCAFPGASLTSR